MLLSPLFVPECDPAYDDVCEIIRYDPYTNEYLFLPRDPHTEECILLVCLVLTLAVALTAMVLYPCYRFAMRLYRGRYAAMVTFLCIIHVAFPSSFSRLLRTIDEAEEED